MRLDIKVNGLIVASIFVNAHRHIDRMLLSQENETNLSCLSHADLGTFLFFNRFGRKWWDACLKVMYISMRREYFLCYEPHLDFYEMNILFCNTDGREYFGSTWSLLIRWPLCSINLHEIKLIWNEMLICDNEEIIQAIFQVPTKLIFYIVECDILKFSLQL